MCSAARFDSGPVVCRVCPGGWMCLAGAPMAIMCSSASGGAEKMPHRPGRLSHDRHPRPNTSTHPGSCLVGPPVAGVVGWPSASIHPGSWLAGPPVLGVVGWASAFAYPGIRSPGRRFRGVVGWRATHPPTRVFARWPAGPLARRARWPAGPPGRRVSGWLAGQGQPPAWVLARRAVGFGGGRLASNTSTHPGVCSPGRRVAGFRGGWLVRRSHLPGCLLAGPPVSGVVGRPSAHPPSRAWASPGWRLVGWSAGQAHPPTRHLLGRAGGFRGSRLLLRWWGLGWRGRSVG
ncbi:hypothetical protein DFQ13_101313 [Actinokineospora spheciospongiae]|nr:hypothetical protein DFQ13_101313 [Actinokineospora spheciospongiae]